MTFGECFQRVSSDGVQPPHKLRQTPKEREGHRARERVTVRRRGTRTALSESEKSRAWPRGAEGYARLQWWVGRVPAGPQLACGLRAGEAGSGSSGDGKKGRNRAGAALGPSRGWGAEPLFKSQAGVRLSPSHPASRATSAGGQQPALPRPLSFGSLIFVPEPISPDRVSDALTLPPEAGGPWAQDAKHRLGGQAATSPLPGTENTTQFCVLCFCSSYKTGAVLGTLLFFSIYSEVQ